MHDKHRDVVFGRRGIYVVIFFIWVVGFASISPDAFGVTGKYTWTSTVYGCDVSYSNHTHYSMATAVMGRGEEDSSLVYETKNSYNWPTEGAV